jgi:hypothetical protein
LTRLEIFSRVKHGSLFGCSKKRFMTPLPVTKLLLQDQENADLMLLSRHKKVKEKRKYEKKFLSNKKSI